MFVHKLLDFKSYFVIKKFIPIIDEKLKLLKKIYCDKVSYDDIIVNIEHVIKTENKERRIFEEQILSLIENNNKYLNIYLKLLNLYKEDRIIESLDNLIDNQNNSINTIKQIKYSLLNIDNIETKEIEEKKELKHYHKSDECLHLYDFNMKKDSEPEEEKIKSVCVNYLDILKREEESKDLKQNLLLELQEFQEAKEFTLEDLLNKD